MKLRNLLVMLLLLTGAVFFVACEGERGPPGPAGADGRVGKDAPRDARCDVSNGIDVAGWTFLIYGTGDDDVICAKNGDSEIRAKAGDDIVYGGGGNDKMIGGDGDDTMYGEGGNDHFYIWEQKGANKWFGGEGKDIIYFRKENTASFILVFRQAMIFWIERLESAAGIGKRHTPIHTTLACVDTLRPRRHLGPQLI